jgi:hypothetical protein
MTLTYNTKSIPKQPAHVPNIMKTEAYRITTSDVRTSLKKFTEIMDRTIPQKKRTRNESITKPDTTTEQGDAIPFLGYLILHLVVDFLAIHYSAS